MKLSEIIESIDGILLNDTSDTSTEYTSAYSADLLSDVLALTKGHTLLITGTVSLQVIRVAEILGITAIIFIRGKMPSPEVIEAAKSKLSIPLVFTRKTMFETSGILYAKGIKPCKNVPADEV
ncbi:MAG: transcriptional regulator [Spirochaetes bacterium]|nr:MAG: transcriptional regulator [Spirochaetota bacterium]